MKGKKPWRSSVRLDLHLGRGIMLLHCFILSVHISSSVKANTPFLFTIRGE
jgi:hypothetical protein